MTPYSAFTGSVKRIGAYLGWFEMTIQSVDRFISVTPMPWYTKLYVQYNLWKMKVAYNKESKDFLNVKAELESLLARTMVGHERKIPVKDFLEKCSEVDHLVEPLFLIRHEKFIPVQLLLAKVSHNLKNMIRRD